jgi:hypothetical protein
MKISYIAIVTILVSITIHQSTFAQCRHNAIDCVNGCRRFTDQNQDGFCDYGRLSQTQEPEIQPDTQPEEETEAVTQIPVAHTLPSQEPAQEAKPIKAKIPKQAAEKAKETTPDTLSKAEIQAQPNHQEPAQQPKAHAQPNPNTLAELPPPPYHLLSITATSLGLYALSLLLVATKRIRKATHRRIWNILLLLSFLISCILGLVLVVQINYQIAQPLLDPFTFWHVEAGIAMTLISIFHIFWHLPYFKQIIHAAKTTR